MRQSKGKLAGMGLKEEDIFYIDVAAGRSEDYDKVRGQWGSRGRISFRPESYLLHRRLKVPTPSSSQRAAFRR